MRQQVEGGYQVLIGLWLMLGVCSLSVLGSCLFLCMAETMIWKEEEGYRVRAIQMDKIRSLLNKRRMNGVPNAQIRELCRMAKGWMKGLRKMFFIGLVTWRGWRMTGLLRGYM